MLLLLAAAATGVLFPLTAVAVSIAEAFLSAGEAVPELGALTLLRATFFTFAVAVVAVGVAVVVAMVQRSWMPIGLCTMGLAGMLVGCVSGVVAASTGEEYALKMFSDRSMGLVHAIERYQRISGHPPRELADLVPRYLTEIPSTGLTGDPEYQYVDDAGPCSGQNAWHFAIPVPEFDVRYLVYCPKQDYDAMDLDEQSKVKQFGAWVRTSM